MRNRSRIAKPISELTKHVPFQWLNGAKNAFNELKNSSINAPVLAEFDPKKKPFVTTDACKYAFGAVMEQDLEDGPHPIAFFSWTLNQHEKIMLHMTSNFWES